MTRLKVLLSLIAIFAQTAFSAAARPDTICVSPPAGDASAALADALEHAAKQHGPTVIILAPGVYNLHSDSVTVRPYRVSNTASETEHPNALKHIGMLLKNLSNLTIDGQSQATIMTHGEMTPWVIDSCTNITLRGFTVDAADPSVTEMTVTARTDSTLTVKVHPDSHYTLSGPSLTWLGHGWSFAKGIAQIHSPSNGTSTRCDYPLDNVSGICELSPGQLLITYSGKSPGASIGDTYQMRHSIRNEVAGLITGSTDVKLDNIHFAFAGNFGVVAQMSRNITYTRLDFSPLASSRRTNAGFADFLQVSSCNGHIAIDSCIFAGSHDDPINIHGTHQLITASTDNTLTLRYMHPQTFGFLAFAAGDTIAITDPLTLLIKQCATVKSARLIDPYTTLLSFDSPLPPSIDGMVVDNLTRTPSVSITNSSFTLTPTRGVLVTTPRPVVIENCTFTRCPMSAILVADDGRSWYESSHVTNLSISHNRFIDCSSPVIAIAPEADIVPGRYVHAGISITDNRFISSNPPTILARSVDGLLIDNNIALDHDGNSMTVETDTLHVTFRPKR